MKIFEVYYDEHNQAEYEDYECEYGQMVSVHKTKEGALKKIENISKGNNLKTFMGITDSRFGAKYILTTINIESHCNPPEELLNKIRNAKTCEEIESIVSSKIDYAIYDTKIITTNYSICEHELED